MASRPWWKWLHVAWVAAGSAACGEIIVPTYDITIATPLDVDPFIGAQRAVLALDGEPVADTALAPGAPFALSLAGYQPMKDERRIISITAYGPDETVVAHGETPRIDIAAIFLRGITVFVQAPGTWASDLGLDLPRSGLVASGAASVDGTMPDRKFRGMIFGTGATVAPNPAQPPSLLEELYAYNPVSHAIEGAVAASPRGGIPQPRRNAASVELSDGRVLLFGGEVRAVSPQTGFVPTAQMDLYRLTGDPLDRVGIRPDPSASTTAAGVARHSTLLAVTGDAGAAKLVYAFGGMDETGPLASVVAIDPAEKTDAVLRLLPQPMRTARTGHTVTALAEGMAGPEVLVFGGAADKTTVAEIFRAAPTPTFDPAVPAGAPGTNRHDHAALRLLSGNVLLIGGFGDDGAPRSDGVEYDPRTGTFLPATVALRTPRAAFAAFVIENDLVIAGGIGPGRARLGDAEIYTTDGRTFVRTVPCQPRSGAAYAALPNRVVVLVGGEKADGVPTGAIELYQPRR